MLRESEADELPVKEQTVCIYGEIPMLLVAQEKRMLADRCWQLPTSCFRPGAPDCLESRQESGTPNHFHQTSLEWPAPSE
ncbi:hypothetical protein ANTHELSMS3_04572 (plasmid) [Antarctobacter heliothermus]|uniref:Uncharacterized protein n=1 Tax=Antarctobacter heliothermus TaxID=74033 RepID=A0A222EBV5_9RHOB|nr:hypothetical protein ANTHELSMS3_04572 [Antarctobacter heliothermus]